MPVLGGTPRRILENVDGDISFDPSGKRFVTVRNDPRAGQAALIVSDTSGSHEQTLVSRQGPNRFKVDSVAWSPDGRSIAALVNRVEALKVDVVLVDATTGQEKALGNHAWQNISDIAWLPTANRS